MLARSRTWIALLALSAVGLASAMLAISATDAADPQPPMLKSKIVRWDDAQPLRADWGELRFYFRGQTRGTKDVLTGVAMVEPGKALHRSHRHAEEEYLIVAKGSGTWSLDGKESPAKAGDILYVEPWVYHGLTNTGDEPLFFVVVRHNAKGVTVPPRPDDRPDEL